MTPTTDLPVALPAGSLPAGPGSPALAFRHKEAALARYLAAFAVVYYRQPAERAPAQLSATLHIETADTAFPPAVVTLQLADDLTLAEVAAEAAARLPMVLAGVAEELGAAITRCRFSLPAPEAQSPEQTWCVTVAFGFDEVATLSFSCPGAATPPRATTYLTEHVQAVVAALDQNPTAPVGYAFFLASEEVAQLRQFLAVPQQVAEGPQQLHQLFAETARTYPHQVALSWLGHTCTYQELDAQANQLAARLQHQGVRPGDFVTSNLAWTLITTNVTCLTQQTSLVALNEEEKLVCTL